MTEPIVSLRLEDTAELAELRDRVGTALARLGLSDRRRALIGLATAKVAGDALARAGAVRVELGVDGEKPPAHLHVIVRSAGRHADEAETALPAGLAAVRLLADTCSAEAGVGAENESVVTLGWALEPVRSERAVGGAEERPAGVPGEEIQALLEVLSDAAAELNARRREFGSVPEREATTHGTLALDPELDQARETEAHLAAIVRSSDDAMFLLTSELVIDSWNPAAERLLGYRQDEIVGRGIDVLIPSAEARREVDHAVAQLQTRDRAAPYDAERRRKDGSVVEVTVTLSAVRDETGGLLGYSAVLHDLSERRKAEEQLAARAERNLLADRERIARDLHDLVIQQLFASGMALQATLGLTSEPQVSRTLEKVVQDLDATIRDIRTTIFDLNRRPEHAPGLRAQLLEVTVNAAAALGFPPRSRFEGPIDAAVPKGVAEHVLAVVRELLSNVARHAQASQVDVELLAGDDLVVVVQDDGRGLSRPSRASGLANMRERAESLGGALRIQNRDGGGTRLEWRVPLR
jgi:two-component system sensor histidine kinase DevS